MAASDPASQCCFAQYRNVLDSPYIYRCSQLTHILATYPHKELKFLFPTLVEDIFGFRNRADWGLLSVSAMGDFQALRTFLSPSGPLMQLCYKLINDHHPSQFEFPIACLPAHSRLALEKGDIPGMYAGKVRKYADNALSSNLQLNSFQLFLFHFAYYIVRAPVKYLHDSVDHTESLYANLLEDYCMYFLPTEGCPVPLPSALGTPSPPSPFRGTDWQSTSNSPLDYSNCTSPYHSTPRPRRSILKPGIVQMLETSSNATNLNNNTSLTNDDWRSEEFISIIGEMYLNQISINQQQGGIFMESYMPNHYHVWMVRILVKHAHYFSNSLPPNNQLLGMSPLVGDAMRQLKTSIFSQYLQKDVHNFLKIIFDKWPLDASFKTPLEMWLSYIQPWRYVQTTITDIPASQMPKWEKFILDNLCFYAPIFLKVLCRFSRMDLSCPRNAFMLFRVSKVFSQEGLDDMIIAAEQTVRTSNLKMSGMNWSYSSFMTSTQFPVDASNFQPQSSDLAGYVSLCSEAVISQVSYLLKEIAVSLKRIELNSNTGLKRKEGMWNSILNMLSFEGNIPESWASDSRKMKIHLEDATQNFCKLFKLQPPKLPEELASLHHGPTDPLEDCFYIDNDGRKLPIMKNIWTWSRTVKPELTYKGNPDLKPVQTTEFPFLVKMFADVSNYLNIKYSEKIKSTYNTPSLVGRMCHQILAPPTTYHKVKKSKDMMSPEYERVYLAPRIELRYFANRNRINIFLLFLLMAYLFGYHLFPVVCLLIIFFLAKIFIKALFHLHKHPNSLR